MSTRIGAAIFEIDDKRTPTPGWRIGASLLILAGPIIATMISRTTMSFVDFVMVSQLGTQAQAAIVPAGILLFCVVSFGMGTMTMVNTFVAQALGRGDFSECSAYAWQGVWLSLVAALIFLPTWWIVPWVFAVAGHAPHVQAMEVIYVRIGLLGLFPMMGAVAVDQFFNGIHRPIVGLWAAVIANVFNGLADYALIFGHFGAPALGIAGAAIATQSAAALQMLILLGWMLRPTMARRYASRRTWRPSLSRIGHILWYGTPAGFQWMSDVVTFTIFTLVLIGEFGTVQLAANNIAFKLLEISFMPTVGLGVAVTAAVGKAIGQEQPNLARRVTRWGAGIGMTYMGMIAVGYLMFRYPLVGLLTDNAAVTVWGARLLILCAVFQVFDAMNIIYVSALRGAGDSHWPAIIAVLAAGAVNLGGGFLAAWLVPQWGATGPWIAATIYIMILGTAFWARWRHGAWKRITLPGTPAG